MAFQGALTPEQIAQDAQVQIRNWQRDHDYAVCIDTDGCVLDNMWAKQLLVFHPLFMDVFGLRRAEMHFRIHAEHHNLWGRTRGCDRYLAVQATLQSMLADEQARAEMDVATAEDILDSVNGYVHFVDSSDSAKAFGMPSIIEYHTAHGRDFNITRLLAWSEAVNRSFKYFTLSMPAFDGVRETLEHLSTRADIMVVSSTPYSDLIEWWGNQNLTQYLQGIAGKEMGKKKDHIAQLLRYGGYEPEHVIMIGDGGGDLRAAKANDVLFYPTAAGREQDAWLNADAAFEAFFEGSYGRSMEATLIDEFENILLPQGPWEQPGYDARTEYLKLQDKRVETYGQLHPEGRLLVLE